MLINSAISIISNGRVALGDLALEIAQNQKKGLNGTDDQNELRRRLVLTYACLKLLDKIIILSGNQIDYILGDYDEVKINRILLFLKGVSGQSNKPVIDKILNPLVEQFGSSLPGQPGTPGVSAYLYIGYADDDQGNGYSTSATGKEYIALKNSSVPLSPINAATFTGLWALFVGSDGADGDDGAPGQSVYIYEAYADDINGTGFTLTFSPTKKFKATKVSTTPLTPVAGDFTGLWAKYIGDDGDDGSPGQPGNTVLSGSGPPSSPIGNNGDYYKDIDSTLFYGPKSAGAWPAAIDLKGDQGDPGTPGTPGGDGDDGANAYIYIAYADAADGTGFTMTYSPTKYWIAILNSTVEIPLPAASDFTGLFRKYIGAGGDRYSTISSTSLTIAASGLLYLNVEANLAYSTGQFAVIALNGNPANRMEVLVVDYNAINGQMTVDIQQDYGSGTFSVWDVNLLGSPTIVITTNHYRGYFDASIGEWPDPALNGAVGSGSAGAIDGGDNWAISNAGTIDGNYYPVGSLITALEAVPGQTSSKFRVV